MVEGSTGVIAVVVVVVILVVRGSRGGGGEGVVVFIAIIGGGGRGGGGNRSSSSTHSMFLFDVEFGQIRHDGVHGGVKAGHVDEGFEVAITMTTGIDTLG